MNHLVCINPGFDLILTLSSQPYGNVHNKVLQKNDMILLGEEIYFNLFIITF